MVIVFADPVNVIIPAFNVPVPVIALPDPARQLILSIAIIILPGVLIVIVAAVPDCKLECSI